MSVDWLTNDALCNMYARPPCHVRHVRGKIYRQCNFKVYVTIIIIIIIYCKIEDRRFTIVIQVYHQVIGYNEQQNEKKQNISHHQDQFVIRRSAYIKRYLYTDVHNDVLPSPDVGISTVPVRQNRSTKMTKMHLFICSFNVQR